MIIAIKIIGVVGMVVAATGGVLIIWHMIYMLHYWPFNENEGDYPGPK